MTKVVLATGHVADSPLSVELIKNLQDTSPVVYIYWPTRPTRVSPAKLSQAVADICRILANGSVELSRSRVQG